MEDHHEIFDYARNRGIEPISTPTSPEIVEFLENLDASFYKIASMDITNVQLIKKVAKTGKPVVLSTGMAEYDDILTATNLLKNNELVLLHCISDYPTDPKDANIKSIEYLKETFKTTVGLSDHSITNEFAIGSVMLGAEIIEKHITYDRNAKEKAEHHFSIEPKELEDLVKSIRNIEKGIGRKILYRSKKENANKHKFRRSLHVNKNLNKGEILKESDIIVVRPDDGDDPMNYEKYIGKELIQNISKWQPLTKKYIL